MLIALASGAAAQQGDREGETQSPPPAEWVIPPAPVLSPQQGLESLQVADGFRVELVASEPLITDPIAIAFDPDGRIWVVEMRGFMPNVDGIGELEPIGRIVILEDEDGDGVMDRSTVFLDHLVSPRAIMLVGEGALVGEPPHLWYCPDADGDLKADLKIAVTADYSSPLDNPEHAANSPMWALDNWIYNANYRGRFRYSAGTWIREPDNHHGQYGLTQDDYGRLYFNTNSDMLRADLAPYHYFRRNPNWRGRSPINVRIMHSQTTWPSRITPGVNRGYQPGTLRPDGTLRRMTAACSPVVYRGDNFPPEFYGNVFVCEPSGNLVKRLTLFESGARVTASHAYQGEEFLTSTDERFRPVSVNVAPDGTLYVIDMYRGIIQHRGYVTTYLRNQILDRGLDKPAPGLGRIYRVVNESKPRGKAPRLASADVGELIGTLDHPNSWWRETAQRLLVERGGPGAVEGLKALAEESENPITRLHALWTLEGLGAIDDEIALNAMGDAHPRVRAAAIRIAEPLLREGNADVLSRAVAMMSDGDPSVRLQLALSLGESPRPEAKTAMERILYIDADDPFIRDAVITGLRGSELESIERLLADPSWNARTPGRRQALSAIASCVMRERDSDRMGRLLELIVESGGAVKWQRVAIASGAAGAMRANTSRFVELDGEPLDFLALTEDKDLRDSVRKLTKALSWPGREEEPRRIVRALTDNEKARFEEGKDLYAISCASCHQLDGWGEDGKAPPLLDSSWALGSVERLARIVMHGLRGPITVNDKDYDMEMPGLVTFTDQQIAATLTYVRREWEHTADPVDAAAIAEARQASSGREAMWTVEELLEIAEIFNED
ncbi:HEAT repeat domain-containing protein [Candidatus Sumerlaeota bacterium]|nr:HEAT repeat domain-containing protein [Candidatus Sumerlaeota bacterium]